MNIEKEIQLSKVPIYVFLMVIVILISLWSYQEHNYARRDRETAMVQRDRIAVIEDRIRDSVFSCSHRSLIIYYVGEDKWGDEILINWPMSIVDLLGWTRKDIEKDGLDIIIREEDVEDIRNLLKTLELSKNRQKTIIMYKDAIHKDGTIVPIRITTWALSGVRALAAYIEAESRIKEE